MLFQAKAEFVRLIAGLSICKVGLPRYCSISQSLVYTAPSSAFAFLTSDAYRLHPTCLHTGSARPTQRGEEAVLLV